MNILISLWSHADNPVVTLRRPFGATSRLRPCAFGEAGVFCFAGIKTCGSMITGESADMHARRQS